MILASVFDEPHDERSIWKKALADHSIKHLIEDKIHHIKREICIRIGRLSTTMSKDEKIYQRASDSVVVASTWSNVLPEDTHKKIIQREKTSNLTRNSFRPIQITEQILVDWKRSVNAMTNWIRRAIKGVAQ
jgi:hypothetical protein